MPSCNGKKKDGRPCPVPARPSGYCWVHDPELARQRAGERRRGGVNPSRPAATLPPGTPDLPLKSVEDVVAALGQTINQVRTGKIAVNVANCSGVLAGVLLKAIEGGDLEQRIAALEGRQDQRRIA